ECSPCRIVDHAARRPARDVQRRTWPERPLGHRCCAGTDAAQAVAVGRGNRNRGAGRTDLEDGGMSDIADELKALAREMAGVAGMHPAVGGALNRWATRL